MRCEISLNVQLSIICNFTGILWKFLRNSSSRHGFIAMHRATLQKTSQTQLV